MKSHIQSITAVALAALAGLGVSAHANILVSKSNSFELWSDDGVLLKTYTAAPGNYQGNAVDAAGNVFVADYNYGIKMYDGVTGAFIRDVTDPTFFGAAWPVYGLASKSNGDLIASYTLGANHHFAHVDTSTTNSATSLSPAWGPPYEGIAYNAGSDKLFATTPNGGGLIQVFDGTSGGFVGPSVAVGTGPKGLVVNAAGDKIYVADNAASVIRLWDGISGTTSVFASVTSAYGVALDDSTGNVFASSYSIGDIKRFDSTGTLQHTFNVGPGVTYITYTTLTPPGVLQDYLYITYGTALGKFTPDGVKIADLATDLINPQGVAVDPAGNVYVSDLGNGRIRMFDVSGAYMGDVMSNTYGGGTPPQPFALAWNQTTGKLSATVSATTSGTQLVDFDVSGTDLASGIQLLGGNYEGLTYSIAGPVLYATVGENLQFFNVNPNTYAGTIYNLTGGAFKGVAIKASTDQKFVADMNNGTIIRIDGVTPTDIVTGLNLPAGVIYDGSSDQIYVAELGAFQVSRYDTSGTLLGSFTVSDNPHYLARWSGLVVSVAENYSSWASGFTSPVLSDTASTADPDNDGLSNAMEYALGLDPRFSSGSPGVASNGGKTITFTKGAEALANGDVTYQIETSTTLGVAPSPWTVDTFNVTEVGNTIAITFPAGPVKNFARLKITLATP